MRAFLLLTVICLFSGCATRPDPAIGRPIMIKEARSYIGLTYSEVVSEKGVVYKRSHDGTYSHGRVKLDDGTSYGYVFGVVPAWSQIFFDKDNKVYRIKRAGRDSATRRAAEWAYDISADKE